MDETRREDASTQAKVAMEEEKKRRAKGDVQEHVYMEVIESDERKSTVYMTKWCRT